jgi:DNA-binding PadR family transcriptional regulator
MKIPELSHLQFLVLSGLHGGERTGREVRDELKRYRVRQSGPAFYQMMARLEKSGLVKGWYTQDVVDGQIIKERRYRITAAGERSWQESRKFYVQAIVEVEGGEELAHA